jgi:hypothetical protein
MAAGWIGFAGGLLAAVISAGVALRQSRMQQSLTRLDHALDEEVQRRTALFSRDLAAEDVLTRYRHPLAAAAFDLQSRLYNILRLDFFAKYGDGHERAEEAIRTTVFRLAQYFGWTEILRRDIQFLSFPEEQATRRVADLQWEISKCFLTHTFGQSLMIWADEQRAIGERMIVEEHGKVLCMGYATFRENCDGAFSEWCARLRAQLADETARPRLLQAQHLLCDLVEMLDVRHLRYSSDDLSRA